MRPTLINYSYLVYITEEDADEDGDDGEDVDLDDVINDIRYMHMMMIMAAVMLVSSQPALLCVIEDVDNDKKENH